tara:strand:- start:92 stop:616 length:525 start_codon:yes stop_codon:yes gene_type:complete
MKLLIENWREYLAEEKPKLNPQQIKQLQDFMKSIVALTIAAEDAGEEDVKEGSAVRKGRMARRRRRQRTKEIKNAAGLAGVKIANFTPEQRKLYDDAKAVFKKQDDEWTDLTIHKIRHGNLLDNPLVKHLVAKGGRPLEIALLGAAAITGCSGSEISLDCIANSLMMSAQGAGI